MATLSVERLNFEKRLAELHRFSVVNEHLNYPAVHFRLDLVHHFHRFKYADDVILVYLVPGFHERVGIRRWSR